MATWLDGCKRQDFGTSGGSWTRQPAIIVLHSTESGRNGWPGYSDGQSAPHFTIEPTTGEKRQHVSLAEASRALKNASGGVETNRGGAVQIEIIGTCDPAHRGQSGWTFLPDLDDWSAVSGLVAQISDACGIPLTSSVAWKAYPGSYGTGASQRLSGSKWQSYRGVLGHQHVPENSHGDPGNINIAAILEGDDMPTAEEIAKEVWRYDQDGAKSQAWSYLQQGTAYQVWVYDQNGGTRQAWAYQKDSVPIHDDTNELIGALHEVQTSLAALDVRVAEVAAQTGPGGRSWSDLDPVWRLLVLAALIAGALGIVFGVQ